MQRTKRAQSLREIQASEEMAELVNEAKGLTWEHFREHAMIKLDDGRRFMIRGGSHGIDLERALPNDPFGRHADYLYLDVDSLPVRVRKLIFHTHPMPTGPSDDDLLVLKLLGQESSMLYEISGPPKGTRIRPQKDK